MATDVRDLVETAKQLTKALESGDPASTFLTLLKPLDTAKVTEDSLRKSKIGVVVTRVRQANKDPKVSEAAYRLVTRWKAEVAKQKSSGGASATGSPAAGAAKLAAANGAARVASSSPAPAAAQQNGKAPAGSEVKEAAGKARPKVDVEKRNTNTDGVNFKLTGEPARDGCLKLMYDGLAYMSEEAPSDILAVARAIELAAFQHFNQTTDAEYKAKIRSLFANLKIKSNDRLRRNVYTGQIKPERFVAMSSEELKSKERQEEDEALEKENLNAAMMAKEEKAISTTMQCGKCKAFKVSYSQAQTRSADEPLTTFCECVVCGHRWKFS